jgi:hypothetical protein
MKESAMRIIAIFTVILVLAGCATTPSIQEGPDAEITYDGLHRVNNSQLGAVWIKPSIDLSKYNKLLLEGAGIQYRAVDPQNRYKRNADEFPLDENQKASIKMAVIESLSDEIRKSEYFTIVDAPGKGVLRIKLGLADVVSRIPPQRGARSDFYIRNLGEAMLVIEYSDSRTNEVLARATDRRAVEPTMAQESSPATNLAEVRRAVRVWGTQIRNSLDELHLLGCYMCNTPAEK